MNFKKISLLCIALLSLVFFAQPSNAEDSILGYWKSTEKHSTYSSGRKFYFLMKIAENSYATNFNNHSNIEFVKGDRNGYVKISIKDNPLGIITEVQIINDNTILRKFKGNFLEYKRVTKEEFDVALVESRKPAEPPKLSSAELQEISSLGAEEIYAWLTDYSRPKATTYEEKELYKVKREAMLTELNKKLRMELKEVEDKLKAPLTTKEATELKAHRRKLQKIRFVFF